MHLNAAKTIAILVNNLETISRASAKIAWNSKQRRATLLEFVVP